ncbi:related to MRPS8 - mitochondrial ribosomal protein, small subunit [Ustilago bromivora]|uniref:Related to MRPS8 - mitochondrial ribosomal protein, small subunit n=1 Tax=Ustilago bromivora TaxID=307758 RepID=A0A8H8QKW4_9BASI|nr:related to MRPS8 - mitochondrial ribosomal protein, small subunit [Ustilago bromivora]
MPLHADLCTILQNASRARLRSIPIASTKDNLSILSILLQHGFIHNVVRGTQTGPSPISYTHASPAARRFWVDLKFRPDDRPVLEKMNVVSKPSRKLTMDKDELLRFATGRRAKFVKPLDMGPASLTPSSRFSTSRYMGVWSVVGWSSHALASQPHSFDQGFGSASQSNPYAADNVTIKARLINLISAVRTLMRIPLVVINIVVVVYLIILG